MGVGEKCKRGTYIKAHATTDHKEYARQAWRAVRVPLPHACLQVQCSSQSAPACLPITQAKQRPSSLFVRSARVVRFRSGQGSGEEAHGIH